MITKLQINNTHRDVAVVEWNASCGDYFCDVNEFDSGECIDCYPCDCSSHTLEFMTLQDIDDWLDRHNHQITETIEDFRVKPN